MSQFLVSYRHGSSQFSLIVPADSYDDAEAKLRSIGANGRVVGSNAMSLPVNSLTLPIAGPLARLIVWWRNLFA